MLQQILTEMYIDPDVLDALNEDQKKTLFLKMRQEQVRRWKEREEKLEREGGDGECKRTKPKSASGKRVSWMLGRDGDVAVIVIGEVDELSSKFIYPGFGEKKSPNLQNNAEHQPILKSKTSSEPVRAEQGQLSSRTQPGVSLSLKGRSEETSAPLPLLVSVSEHPSPPAADEPKSPDGPAEKLNPGRPTPFSVRPASAHAAPGSLNATLNPKAPTGPSQGARKPREALGGAVRDSAASDVSKEPKPPASGPNCVWRGRVTELMKTFSSDSPAAPPRGVKPPLPTKPSHLQLTGAGGRRTPHV